MRKKFVLIETFFEPKFFDRFWEIFGTANENNFTEE